LSSTNPEGYVYADAGHIHYTLNDIDKVNAGTYLTPLSDTAGEGDKGTAHWLKGGVL
jgi:hypothetical protein